MAEVNFEQHQALFRQMMDAQAAVLAHKKAILERAHEINAMGPEPVRVIEKPDYFNYRSKRQHLSGMLENSIIRGLVLQALYEDAYATYQAAYNPAYVIPFGQT